jgi:hypothetical protein
VPEIKKAPLIPVLPGSGQHRTQHFDFRSLFAVIRYKYLIPLSDLFDLSSQDRSLFDFEATHNTNTLNL